MSSKNIRHLHAHEVAINASKVIIKTAPAALPLCNHSIAIYNDLNNLFAQQDWFGLGDIFSFMRSKPLHNLPLDSNSLKNTPCKTKLDQGSVAWQKFSYYFINEHQTKYCQRGFEDFMYCSFAKYYQPKIYEQLQVIFTQEWQTPCTAVEGSQCSLASINLLGLVKSFDFKGGAFGHISFHADGSATQD